MSRNPTTSPRPRPRRQLQGHVDDRCSRSGGLAITTSACAASGRFISGGVGFRWSVTVADDPNETQWFGSVAATAADYGITAITPSDANTPELQRKISDLQPDFIFSFYDRSMLGAPLLAYRPAWVLSTCTAQCCRSIEAGRRYNWAILRG